MTQPRSDPAWRAVLNQLIYGLTYVRELDDAVAQVFARRMIERRIFGAGAESYHRALEQAAREPALFGPAALPTDHDEQDVRRFCARVVHYLDVGQPWPDQRFVRLPITAWPWEQAPVTAVIRTGMHGVSAAVWHVFEFVHRVHGVMPVLVLRQRSGDVLALVVRTGSPAQRRTTELKVLQGDPGPAIESFVDLTGLPADAVDRSPAEPAAREGEPSPAVTNERELFRVFVADGRLWRADTGTPYDTTRGATLRPGPPRAIFVMDRQANIFASLVETIGEFHHTSLASGGPVAAAGELVVRRGTLVEISGRCPTYPVSDAEVQIALSSLREQGLPTAGVTVH
ncbi:MAG TPA: hypothetical protein VH561_00305 [Micromonosporaceae bacterium]